MPSIVIMDRKSFEMVGGWLASNSTREILLKDSTTHFEDAAQFINDFCAIHKALFPEASIYKSIEL